MICASLSISKRPRPGMCFALPIDVIRVMGARFIEEREGVRGGQIKSDMANCNGLPLALREELSYTARDGVVLFDLEKKAKDAGLRERDIVTAVDGVKIKNWMHLRVRLALQAPGNTVKFTIARKGKSLEIPFVLEPRS